MSFLFNFDILYALLTKSLNDTSLIENPQTKEVKCKVI